MPYIKKKGIRDLYLIKIARVGTRKEGQPDNDPNDFRLVFEIAFVKKFFKDYKPIELGDLAHVYRYKLEGDIGDVIRYSAEIKGIGKCSYPHSDMIS